MGILGPNKKELYQSFKEIFGGDYYEGNWNNGPRLKLEYKLWTLYLDTYVVSNGKSSTTFTRLRACLRNRSDYDLKIKKRHIFSNISEIFSSNVIKLEDEDFDNLFLVKSNDELKTLNMLKNYEIRELLNLPKKMNLSLSRKKHQYGSKCLEGESVLSYMVPYVIKDSETIDVVLRLFRLILDELFEMDIIDEGNGITKLYKEKDLEND